MTMIFVMNPAPPTIVPIASATPEPSTIGVASMPSSPSTPWKVNGTRVNSTRQSKTGIEDCLERVGAGFLNSLV